MDDQFFWQERILGDWLSSSLHTRFYLKFAYLTVLLLLGLIVFDLDVAKIHAQPTMEKSGVMGLVDSLVARTRQVKETDTDSARQILDLLQEVIDGSNSIDDDPYLPLLEGEILLEENEEEQGLAKVNESRLLFEKTTNDSGLAQVYDALTKFYLRSAQYPEALTEAFRAIELKERMGDDHALALSLLDVADIYWYYGRISESLEYGLRAKDLIEDYGPSNELAACYKLLSESYLEVPEYDLALSFIEKSISVKQSLGASDLELSSSINSRGNVYKYLKRYDDAIADYSKVLETCDAAGLKIGIRASAANLGHVFLLKHEYPLAVKYKLRSLAIQKESGQIQQQAENLQHLSEAYFGLGKIDSAYHYRLILDTIKTKEHKQALDKLTNELSVKYETEKKEEAISRLSERLRLQRISMILGAALLILSLVAVLIFIRLNNQLKEKNRQNVVLLKEIHHRVKNNLQILSSLLSLQADHLVDTNAIDAISEGKNRVESMGMIHQRLYSGADITTVHMKEYIHDLCRFLEDSFSASQKVIKIKDHVVIDTMDVDYAIPLGLIINELVTNSVKYAFSGKSEGSLRIDLYEERKILYLRVSDDGSGEVKDTAEKVSSSFGSKLIETLSKKMRGEVKVDLHPGYTTTIHFTRYKN